MYVVLFGYSGFLHQIKWASVTIPMIRITYLLCSSLVTIMNVLD